MQTERHGKQALTDRNKQAPQSDSRADAWNRDTLPIFVSMSSMTKIKTSTHNNETTAQARPKGKI